MNRTNLTSKLLPLLILLIACIAAGTLSAQGTEHLTSVELFLEFPELADNVEPEDIEVDEQSLEHTIVVTFQSFVDVEALYVSLLDAESNPVVDRSFQLDGSDLPAGYTLSIEGDALYLNIGQQAYHEDAALAVHALLSGGGVSNTVTLE